MKVNKFTEKGIALVVTILAAGSLSGCSGGGKPDSEACGLIQEGYQNLQALLQDKYWIDSGDSGTRFDSARIDYGTTFQFIDAFQIPRADFDAAAQKDSVSDEDKAKLRAISEHLAGVNDFYQEQPKPSLKFMQLTGDLVPVVAICN